MHHKLPLSRRYSFQRLAPIAILVGAALFATSCSSGGQNASSTSSSKKPTLSIGIPASTFYAANLNPSQAGYNVLAELTYGSLIGFNQAGTSYAPGLAAGYGYVGTGNKEYKFTIRSGAKFSNGQPVTGVAVKSSMELWLKDSTFATRLGVSSIQAAGQTVTLNLSSPSPDVPFVTTAYNFGDIVAPQASSDPNLMAAATFGAGPYMVDAAQSVANSSYVLVPNPYYYDKAAIKWSQITIRLINDPASMLDALESGQIQVAQGDSSTYKAAESAGLGIDVQTAGTFMVRFDGFGKSPLSNVKVRQALNYALDRNVLAKDFGVGTTTGTSEDTTLNGWVSTLKNYYPYDPQKAKQLLAQAGYSHGLSLELATEGSQPYLGMAEAIAKYFDAVGVNTSVPVVTTVQAFLGEVAKMPLEFSEAPVETVHQWYVDTFSPTSFFDLGHYPFPALADLVNNASSVSSAQQSAAQWQNITKFMVQNAYSEPIGTLNIPWYYKKSAVRGVTGSVLQTGSILAEALSPAS